MTADLELGPLHVGVIGAGRLGCVIGLQLAAQGLTLVHASSASAAGCDEASHVLGVPVSADAGTVLHDVDCVVITVPDDQLPSVIDELEHRPADSTPRRLRIVTTSATTPLTAFAGVSAAGHDVCRVHPVTAVHGPRGRGRIAGAVAVVAGVDAASTTFAHAFAHALDLTPIDLDERATAAHALAAQQLETAIPPAIRAARSIAIDGGVPADVVESAYGRLAASLVEIGLEPDR